MQCEIEIGEPARLAESFGRRLAREAERGQSERGRFVLALPGGSAAATFVPAVAAAALDWRRIDLFWVDERAVPPEDPESNFALAWRSGLESVPLEPSRMHRLHGEARDLDGAAREAERALSAALGNPRRLDLALVGVGTDGHVASLFPGHAALAESERQVVAIDDAPKPPARRLSVTLPLFAAVDLLVVGAFGAEKAAVVRAAIEDRTSMLPIARAARLAARRLFLLDAAAAAGLAGAQAPRRTT